MSKSFEPPGLHPGQWESKRVEINMSFVNGNGQTWDGAFASHKLLQCEELVKAGIEGWRLIEALFGDDWGPPPQGVQFLVRGKVVASINYDRPKRSRR
jgi:hypothetical protein